MTSRTGLFFKLLQRRALASRQNISSTVSLSSVIAALILAAYTSAPQRVTAQAPNPIPVLSYYYIWFDANSWDRAKVDVPILGNYSSDDAGVMLQHIKWAKAAGIDGFIVSWKSTDKLNPRLRQLVDLANQENFKLAIIYEGLDFNREPLSIEQVGADLDYFIANYADNPAFDLYGKPLIIWSGTWKFSFEEIQSITQGRREHLLILASEKNVDGYVRLENLVDGDAYYWSSVNPDTHPGYVEKLTDMGKAIHANGGIWIAPAAPGFDARLVGGTTVVERKDGQTLQAEMNAAYQSAPDAVGLISWNEFSENSHIEPSINYGNQYLQVLADILHVTGPVIYNFDSSEPAGIENSFSGNASRLVALGSLAMLTLGGLWLVIRRNK
jgi:Glycosyl hydrolase family 99